MASKSNDLLSKTAYTEIRNALRDGSIRPGDRIRERELSDTLGLGRTPIREALKRLEFEGFLAHSPETGLVYRKLTQTDIVEIHAVVGVLLGLAASEAARNANDAEIHAMQELLAHLSANVEKSDSEVLRAAHRLDTMILASARNQFLLAQLELISDRLGLQSTGKSTFTRIERRQAFKEDMTRTVNAISNRDAIGAERAARERSERGLRARLSMDFEESDLGENAVQF
ncbi:MAG: GntR family transcriptional regulator [Vannielia sp.]|uniref:GntR family transcriptional regulator n=1 Tax=Vannielia sp. TaxID=2813045 RepID=UPI003B8D5357